MHSVLIRLEENAPDGKELPPRFALIVNPRDFILLGGRRHDGAKRLSGDAVDQSSFTTCLCMIYFSIKCFARRAAMLGWPKPVQGIDKAIAGWLGRSGHEESREQGHPRGACRSEHYL